MEQINELVGTCLSAIFQLRRLAGGNSSRPEVLHRHMKGFIDDLMKRAAAAGFTQTDVQDMAYAIVALADEVALGLSDTVRDYWMTHLLQFQYFKENQAGEGFFARLKQVRSDPNRTPVLMVYYLALSFGFQGKFGVRGGELDLASLQEDLVKDLGRSLPNGFEEDLLSAHAERPAETSVATQQSRWLIALAAGGVVLALVFFVGLRIALSSAIGDVSKAPTSVSAKKVKANKSAGAP